MAACLSLCGTNSRNAFSIRSDIRIQDRKRGVIVPLEVCRCSLGPSFVSIHENSQPTCPPHPLRRAHAISGSRYGDLSHGYCRRKLFVLVAFQGLARSGCCSLRCELNGGRGTSVVLVSHQAVVLKTSVKLVERIDRPSIVIKHMANMYLSLTTQPTAGTCL